MWHRLTNAPLKVVQLLALASVLTLFGVVGVAVVQRHAMDEGRHDRAPQQVEVVARERANVVVSIDDEVVFDGTLWPGESKHFSASSPIVVHLDRIGAVRIKWDDQTVRLHGTQSERRTLTFGARRGLR